MCGHYEAPERQRSTTITSSPAVKAIAENIGYDLKPVEAAEGSKRFVVFAKDSRPQARRAAHDLRTWHPNARITDAVERSFEVPLRGAEPIPGRNMVSIDIDLETASVKLVEVWAFIMGWLDDDQPDEARCRQVASIHVEGAERKLALKWVDQLFGKAEAGTKPVEPRPEEPSALELALVNSPLVAGVRFDQRNGSQLVVSFLLKRMREDEGTWTAQFPWHEVESVITLKWGVGYSVGEISGHAFGKVRTWNDYVARNAPPVPQVEPVAVEAAEEPAKVFETDPAAIISIATDEGNFEIPRSALLRYVIAPEGTLVLVKPVDDDDQPDVILAAFPSGNSARSATSSSPTPRATRASVVRSTTSSPGTRRTPSPSTMRVASRSTSRASAAFAVAPSPRSTSTWRRPRPS